MSRNIPNRGSSVDESDDVVIGAPNIQRRTASSQEHEMPSDSPPPYEEIDSNWPGNTTSCHRGPQIEYPIKIRSTDYVISEEKPMNSSGKIYSTKHSGIEDRQQYKENVKELDNVVKPSTVKKDGYGVDNSEALSRLETMEQVVTETRQTTNQTHQLQQTMNQRLEQIERHFEVQGNQIQSQHNDRSGREEEISLRVVEHLVNNEKFQSLMQIQDSSATRTPSSQECRRCHCFRCRCSCHLLSPHEKWKREGSADFYGANKKSCHMQLSQDTASDVESVTECKNNFYESSDTSDHEFFSDGDTPVRERKKEKQKLPILKEQEVDNAALETHGASGGDPGQPPDDDPSGDDDNDDDERKDRKKQSCRDIKDNKKKTVKWEIDPNLWKSCIEVDFENKAARFLDERKLPNQALLNEACLKYKRTNPCVQRICQCICSYIKENSELILDVWAAYRYKKSDISYGNKIVFVVLTKHTDNVDIQEFTTYKRCIHDVTTQEENWDLKNKEREDPLSAVELQDLERSLRETAVAQMERHSKLTRVTASWYESKGYGTEQYSQQKRPCIALYVHVKGYVPLNEEPFSSEIGGYRVDVREGVLLLCGRGPNDYHRNVKMGCEIRGHVEENQMYIGTLGAFIEFENDRNLYALTSAHVLFIGEKLKNILEKGVVKYDQYDEIVYQPAKSIAEFGKTMVAIYREGGNGIPGMEIAVIKINPERIPDIGAFPDDPAYIEKGFGPDKPLEFYTGKVCEPTHLSDSRLVFKYGSQTKLTEGLCRVRGSSVRTQVLRDSVLDCPIVMHDQIEIESTRSMDFAVQGDSGALVLTKYGSELVAVGIFEGKMDDVYVVTPMLAILDALKRQANKECRLKTFQSCDPRPRDTRFLEERVSAIVNEKLERIDQGFTHHLAVNKEEARNELKQNLAVHKDEIRGELAVHKNEMRDELTLHKNEIKDDLRKHADEQSKDLKDHMTSVIQDLFLKLPRQNSP